MNNLRFIDDPARNGAINMAIDDLLARKAEKSHSSVVFRVYKWDSPTLSCGFHQRVERRIDFDSCERKKVHLVRRPTGGRELLHDGDLSFSLTAPFKSYLQDLNRTKSYFFAAGKIITEGLNSIGLKAELVNSVRRKHDNRYQPCLAVVSEYEIVCEGKKIAPMAQRVYQGSVLVHGSIPLRSSKILTAGLLEVADRSSLQQMIDKSSTSLDQIMNEQVDVGVLKESLKNGFQNVLKGRVESYCLTRRELTEAIQQAYNWEITINQIKLKQ